MDSIPNSSVTLQLVPESQDSIPEWLAEVVVIVESLRQQGALTALLEEVNLVRGRMGTFETFDFLAVLIGYAVSGMTTLKSFLARLAPFGEVFMGLFGRNRLPSHAALSRFLAAMTLPCVQALREVFERFSFGFGWTAEVLGGLTDRSGERLLVFDVDGTRAVARQRRLPSGQDLPDARRRMEKGCAVGYPGRKRGEVLRSRMTVLTTHTHQWLFTYGGRGNGKPEEEVRASLAVITRYLKSFGLPSCTALLRLDGQFGLPLFVRLFTRAGQFFVTRSIGYHLLEVPTVAARLSLPATASLPALSEDQSLELFDAGEVDLDAEGLRGRLIVLRRPAPAGHVRHAVGKRIGSFVYELFLTTLPATRLLAQDVLDLYRGRGGFENDFAAEDQETDPDRWCSHSPSGQDGWQILAQWVWNLRQVLGNECWVSPAVTSNGLPRLRFPLRWRRKQSPTGHGRWLPRPVGPVASASKPPPFPCTLMAQCLVLKENPSFPSRWWPKRRLSVSARSGRLAPRPVLPVRSVPFVWAIRPASAPVARSAPSVTSFPLLPTTGLLAPLRWQDVPARAFRRQIITHFRHQLVTLTPLPCDSARPLPRPPRAERSHQRLSWAERRSRNAGPPTPRFSITVSRVSPLLLSR